jgi:hypothetical protein
MKGAYQVSMALVCGISRGRIAKAEIILSSQACSLWPQQYSQDLNHGNSTIN